MKEKSVAICKVGEKGQIVIPKDARKMFNINPGDSVVVLSDINKGIAIIKADFIENMSSELFNNGNKND